MILDIIILIVLLVLSAFFSLAETAFMAVSRLKAETLSRQKVPGAETLLKLKEKPREVIITILIGNNLANTAAAALATALATQQFGSNGIGIATGVMTFLLLTFGEITPKSFATIHAEKIALPLAKPIGWIMILFSPLVVLFEWMTSGMIRMFGSTKKIQLFSEAELRTLVEMGVKEQHLDKTEKEFIEGVLEFKQCVVADIMTPKRRMYCLEEQLPVEQALVEINKREHTRIPLYSGTKEHISGILYLKDVLKAIAEQKFQLPVRDIAKKPILVEQQKPINKLFKEFQTKHIHIAIVVDKKAAVKGLVTMEDIIEEIVGDILDEKDISPTLIKRVDKMRIIAHGDTEIDYINKFFNIQIPKQSVKKSEGQKAEGKEEKEQVTLNDFLATLQKRPWQEGTKVRYHDLTFIIKVVEENKPIKVLIEKV